MSTTTSTSSVATASSAVSAKLKAFVIVFSLAAPILYVLCEFLGLPLFTYHPATDRVDLGWAPGRRGEGPAMYWYGWTATMLIGSTVLGSLAALLPERLIQKLPLALIWIVPILALGPLAWALMPFWTKG